MSLAKVEVVTHLVAMAVVEAATMRREVTVQETGMPLALTTRALITTGIAMVDEGIEIGTARETSTGGVEEDDEAGAGVLSGEIVRRPLVKPRISAHDAVHLHLDERLTE